MMDRLLVPTLLLFSTSLLSSSSPVKKDWTSEAFWDGGKAEISVYEARLPREGSLRNGEVTHVLVKEDHFPQLDVKADNWKQVGLVPRIKFNEMIDMPTGVYSYHQMLSIFINRSDFSIPKIVFTSQEWCGQTSKELNAGDSQKAKLSFNSYWDGEGKGEKTLDLSGNTLPYNALPVYLRAMIADKKKSAEMFLLSDLVSNRVGNPTVQKATAVIERSEKLVIGKRAIAAAKVTVTIQNQKKRLEDRFWFSEEELQPSYPMLRWERSDGGTYQLRKRLTEAYWELNRPGDEKLLK
jgi:hypothetical protein